MKTTLATSKKIKLHTLIKNMPIEKYHGDKGTYSSSQFKDLLDDTDIFIKKHVLKVVEREENAAFDVGTYFHTGILEPHKLNVDCTVYPGKIRRGAEWEKFKKNSAGKTIVTKSQKDQAEGLVQAVLNSPIAQEYLDGIPEVSLFVKIWILRGEIYAPEYGLKLSRLGWVSGRSNPLGTDHFEIVVKVRADMLGQNYISDLKSTTGNARSNKAMREKISYYQYDLSAALYLDMFYLVRPTVKDFYWIFASKDHFNSKTYRAHEDNILVGRAKYMKAMIRMADCAAANWKTVDYLDVLEPLPQDREHLREKDTDLL